MPVVECTTKKEKIPGAGTKIYYDINNDGNWQAICCAINLTPPPRERETSESACLEDFADDIPVTSTTGMESQSLFTFEVVRDLAHQEYTDLTTIFERNPCNDNKDCGWRIVYDYCDADKTEEFKGQILSLVPSQVVRGEVITETVTVERSNAITLT